VLRDHLPELFQNVRKKYPNLKIALREAYHPELESLLEKDELDLAVTLIEKKSAPGSTRWRCWNCHSSCWSKKQQDYRTGAALEA